MGSGGSRGWWTSLRPRPRGKGPRSAPPPPRKEAQPCLLLTLWCKPVHMCVCVCARARAHAQAHVCAKLLQSCPTPCDPMDSRLLCPWDSPGKNTGVGCHFLLQGIFPAWGSNRRLLCLLRWQADSLSLAPLGKSHLPLSLWSQARPGLVTKAWFTSPGTGRHTLSPDGTWAQPR